MGVSVLTAPIRSIWHHFFAIVHPNIIISLGNILLFLGIANIGLDAAGFGDRRGQTFVKDYSNFDPKKWGVLTTKESFGRKNAIF